MMTGNSVAGPDNVYPVDCRSEPGKQAVEVRSYSATGLSSSPAKGWIKLESTAAKVNGFYTIFNPDFTILDGTTLTPESSTSLLFPEVEGGAYTKLNIANNNSEKVDLTIEL